MLMFVPCMVNFNVCAMYGKYEYLKKATITFPLYFVRIPPLFTFV